MLPSAEALHLRRVRRNLVRALCEPDFEGIRNPQGGRSRSRRASAAGRMKSPEAVPEQRPGPNPENIRPKQISRCFKAIFPPQRPAVEASNSFWRAAFLGLRHLTAFAGYDLGQCDRKR